MQIYNKSPTSPKDIGRIILVAQEREREEREREIKDKNKSRLVRTSLP